MSSYQAPAPPPSSTPSQLQCKKCGKVDPSLRVASFPYVVSVLIMTFRRGSGGIYCGPCRTVEALKYGGLTAVAGWWGFPWGPIFTVPALIANARGGKQPADKNSLLLAVLGKQFAEQGRTGEAIKAGQESMRLAPNAAASELLAALNTASPS